MALRAKRKSDASELLSTLESEYGYRLVAPEELAIFLDHYPVLYHALVQASAAIEDFFPNRTETELCLSKDYDGEDMVLDGMLVITVELPPMSIDEQIDTLDAFIDRWLSGPAKESLTARELVFNIRPID
jgi:hypothetical protein